MIEPYEFGDPVHDFSATGSLVNDYKIEKFYPERSCEYVDYYKKCSKCGKESTTDTVRKSTGKTHKWRSYANKSEPWRRSNANCTEPETFYQSCANSGCDQVNILKWWENGNALGHEYGEWSTTPATCISTGVKSRTCSRCNFEENNTLELDSSNHSDTIDVYHAIKKSSKHVYFKICKACCSKVEHDILWCPVSDKRTKCNLCNCNYKDELKGQSYVYGSRRPRLLHHGDL